MIRQYALQCGRDCRMFFVKALAATEATGFTGVLRHFTNPPDLKLEPPMGKLPSTMRGNGPSNGFAMERKSLTPNRPIR